MKKRNIFLSASVVLCVLPAAYLFIKPVLATQDDTFAEYLLAKGFSAATLRVTYFEYCYLFYEKPFAFLYDKVTGINWLSIFYVFMHCICGILILYYFFNKKRTAVNIFSVIAYLLLFFIPLVTKLCYTTVAGHCIITCFFIFIDSVLKKENPSLKKLLFVFILFVLGASLRMHITIPLMIIMLPFFLVKKNTAFKKWLLTFSVSCIIIAAAFFFHKADYEKNIPRWNDIIQVINAEYQLGNFGYSKKKLITETDSFKRTGFIAVSHDYLYDDTLLNAKFLDEMKTFASKKIIGNRKEIYWLSTDVKQFLFLLIPGIIILCFYYKNKKIKFVVLLANAAAVMLSASILLFMKFPERVWLLIFLLQFLITFYASQEIKFNEFNTVIKCLCLFAAAAVIFIQSLRINDIKNENEKGIDNFICANKIVNNYPQKLFIEYNDGYPFNNFPAFSLPSQYPFRNVLFPFFLTTELRENTMKPFEINNVSAAIVSSKKIILIGKPDQALADYLFQTQHVKISFARISAAGSCLDLYEVNAVK